MTVILGLTREVASDRLYVVDGKTYYHYKKWASYTPEYSDFYEVTNISATRTQYVDADERPWDDSHDGNGWQERVRDYTLAHEPVPAGDLLDRLVYARDLHWAMYAVDSRWVAALPTAERPSYERALVEVYRSGYKLIGVRGEDGTWTAQERHPAPTPADDGDEWETL